MSKNFRGESQRMRSETGGLIGARLLLSKKGRQMAVNRRKATERIKFREKSIPLYKSRKH